MRPAIQRDITDAREMLTKLAAKLPTFEPGELADLGAQMKELARTADAIADGWFKKSNGEETLTQPGCKQLMRPAAVTFPDAPGKFIVLGSHWKAIFAAYVNTRIDTTALEKAMPKIADQFRVSKDCERVSYKGL